MDILSHYSHMTTPLEFRRQNQHAPPSMSEANGRCELEQMSRNEQPHANESAVLQQRPPVIKTEPPEEDTQEGWTQVGRQGAKRAGKGSNPAIKTQQSRLKSDLVAT